MGAEYPHVDKIEYLVFEGGGVKGIAYLGAIQRLYDPQGQPHVPRDRIRGVGGTSAGAITALAVSFGLGADEIEALADSLHFAEIRQRPGPDDFPELNWWNRWLLRRLSKVFGGDVWSVYSLYRNYGWYSSDYFYGWLRQTIGGQLGSDGTETFAEFKSKMVQKIGRYIDLRVHVTDVSAHATRVFSHDLTPDVEVASAVRMSMSIPLFFEAIPFDGDVYCDGGVIVNYPIELFDQGNSHWETLGLHLCSPPASCPGSDSPKDDPSAPDKPCPAVKPVTGLPAYIESLFESMQVPSSMVRPDDVERTVEISNYCVGTTDFDIQSGTADYNGLYNNGWHAADRFLSDWPPPSPCGS